MTKVISSKTIELARQVFIGQVLIENEVIEPIYPFTDFPGVNNFFKKFGSTKLSKAEQLLVSYYKETRPEAYAEYQRLQQSADSPDISSLDEHTKREFWISINRTQSELNALLQENYINKYIEASKSGAKQLTMGILIAGLAAICYFLPVMTAILLAIVSLPAFVCMLFYLGKDGNVQEGKLVCMVLAFIPVEGMIFRAALIAAPGFYHGMAIFSYVLAAVSALLLVSGILHLMLGIPQDKAQYFDTEIKPSLSGEYEKIRTITCVQY
jgi:hypothetical protein